MGLMQLRYEPRYHSNRNLTFIYETIPVLTKYGVYSRIIPRYTHLKHATAVVSLNGLSSSNDGRLLLPQHHGSFGCSISSCIHTAWRFGPNFLDIIYHQNNKKKEKNNTNCIYPPPPALTWILAMPLQVKLWECLWDIRSGRVFSMFH